MRERTNIYSHVWATTSKLDISYEVGHSIINSYISYCKELLIQGVRVDFPELVSIVPDNLVSEYTPTLAYNCSNVADILAIPQNTVYRVLDDYIEQSLKALDDGRIVEIRSLVVVKPIFNANWKVITVNSSISQSLKDIIRGRDTNVTGFRVHTYKSLRDRFSK